MVLLALMGDVMLGRLVDEDTAQLPMSYVWGDTLSILQKADFRLINLETTLTSCEKAVPKVFNFRARPTRVHSLTEAHIDVVNLANNHSLDFGFNGLFETLETLDKAHVKRVGAGKNADEARRPVILNRGSISIGILGCTDNEPGWIAGEDKPGVHYVDIADPKSLIRDVKELRKRVDFVILTIHWGPNMREHPDALFIKFAHMMIDNGVDIIHGHSAHIFQGVEFYKNKLILYDTGDFIDDYRVDPVLRNDRSFLFLIEVSKQKIEHLFLIPILISNHQANLAKGEDFEWAKSRMQQLSKEFGMVLKE